MPIEPRPAGWVLPDVRTVPPGVEFVAVGAELTAGMLLAGYRRGLFAMPEPGLLGWWSPDPRGILWPASLHVSRSLRRSLGRFTVSLDQRFDAVVEACADPRRPHGWISAQYRTAYAELHRLGWAHSIEVWDGSGALAGGLFGVEVGGLFAAESKFHATTDASKVAVVALAQLLSADGHPDRLIDVQWRTEHLATFGVVEVPRTRYLELLDRALMVAPALGAAAGAPASPGSGPPPSRIRWRTG
jgi:leucyl/phenylalanyl-tRNA--protein transferase